MCSSDLGHGPEAEAGSGPVRSDTELEMAKQKKAESTRRDFLKLSGIGAAAGAAAIAATDKPAEAATRPAKASAGYRETEHVKTAYALSRF